MEKATLRWKLCFAQATIRAKLVEKGRMIANIKPYFQNAEGAT